MRITGNGEGLTALLLTDAESRLIREAMHRAVIGGFESDWFAVTDAWGKGIQRATERMKAEEKAGRKKA